MTTREDSIAAVTMLLADGPCLVSDDQDSRAEPQRWQHREGCRTIAALDAYRDAILAGQDARIAELEREALTRMGETEETA